MNTKNVVIFFFLPIFIFAIQDDLIVNTKNGPVKGRIDYSLRNLTFYSFLEIPYAKPPVGNLRFREPEPAEPWKGVLDGTKSSKICYQEMSSESLHKFETEDCLILNVYVPKIKHEGPLPVMFWIYGGGFANGYATFNMYGPHYILEHEVVLVSVNYRVGPFGFLSTGDTVIPGNYGLKDQNLALKWVRDNIKNFDGDPDKVTIFGQSAGGASVTYHLMSQQSKGLFRAGIAQSGSVLCPWTYQRKHKQLAYQIATNLDPKFNKTATSEELLTFLRKHSAREIYSNLRFGDELGDSLVQGTAFNPSIEPKHPGAFLTETQYEALERGDMNRVPLLIGTTSEEMIAWKGGNKDNLLKRMKIFDVNTTRLVNWNMHLNDSKQLTEVGNAIRKIYTDGLFQDHLGRAVSYYSDMCFSKSIIHHAKLQSQFSDVYFYIFSYSGPLGRGNGHTLYKDAEKVGHSEDCQYQWAFGNNTDLSKYPPSEAQMVERYNTLFTNFAKTLNPTPEQLPLLPNIIWPKVKSASFQYLDINANLTVKINPKGDAYKKWVEIYQKYGVKPFDTF